MTQQSASSVVSRSTRWHRRHLVARRGATAVLVALCALPIVGVLALAVDIGVFYRARRNQQNAADAAALAWAHERYSHPSTGTSGADTRLATAATAHGYTNGTNGTLISSSLISWQTSTNAIRVTIRDTVSTFFSGVLGRSKTVVAATAVATYDLANSTACVYALDPDDVGALSISGNATISMPGCGVQVNSTASGALSANGNFTLTTASTGVAGTWTRAGGSGSFNPTPVNGVLQAADPLASVTIPTLPVGFTCAAKTTYQGGGPNQPPEAVPSGVYCNRIVIKKPVTLASGTYYLLGGMEISGNAHVTGANVNFINTKHPSYTAGNIDVQGGPTMNLRADTTVMKGILFYQSPLLASPTYDSKIRGGPDSDFRGTLYFPAADLDMSGNSAFTFVGSVVANNVLLGGTGNLTVPTVTASTAGWFSVKRPTLVD